MLPLVEAGDAQRVIGRDVRSKHLRRRNGSGTRKLEVYLSTILPPVGMPAYFDAAQVSYCSDSRSGCRSAFQRNLLSVGCCVGRLKNSFVLQQDVISGRETFSVAQWS